MQLLNYLWVNEYWLNRKQHHEIYVNFLMSDFYKIMNKLMDKIQLHEIFFQRSHSYYIEQLKYYEKSSGLIIQL